MKYKILVSSILIGISSTYAQAGVFDDIGGKAVNYLNGKSNDMANKNSGSIFGASGTPGINGNGSGVMSAGSGCTIVDQRANVPTTYQGQPQYGQQGNGIPQGQPQQQGTNWGGLWDSTKDTFGGLGGVASAVGVIGSATNNKNLAMAGNIGNVVGNVFDEKNGLFNRPIAEWTTGDVVRAGGTAVSLGAAINNDKEWAIKYAPAIGLAADKGAQIMNNNNFSLPNKINEWTQSWNSPSQQQAQNQQVYRPGNQQGAQYTYYTNPDGSQTLTQTNPNQVREMVQTSPQAPTGPQAWNTVNDSSSVNPGVFYNNVVPGQGAQTSATLQADSQAAVKSYNDQMNKSGLYANRPVRASEPRVQNTINDTPTYQKQATNQATYKLANPESFMPQNQGFNDQMGGYKYNPETGKYIGPNGASVVPGPAQGYRAVDAWPTE